MAWSSALALALLLALALGRWLGSRLGWSRLLLTSEVRSGHAWGTMTEVTSVTLGAEHVARMVRVLLAVVGGTLVSEAVLSDTTLMSLVRVAMQ